MNLQRSAGDCKFINVNLHTEGASQGLKHIQTCKHDAVNYSQSSRARFSESGVSLKIIKWIFNFL